jgi:hypothetical protein
METLLVILAYKDGEETFKRNLPYFERHKASILIVTNYDLKVIHPQLILGETMAMGGHSGMGAYLRNKYLLEYLRDWTDFEQYVLMEYDAICTLKDFPKFGYGYYGVIHCNFDCDRFSANQYAQNPNVLNRKALSDLADAFDLFPRIIEGGYMDRLFSGLARAANIPTLPFDPPGFGRNTITPEFQDLAVRAIRNGARWIHGIKSKEQLDLVISTSRECGFI